VDPKVRVWNPRVDGSEGGCLESRVDGSEGGCLESSGIPHRQPVEGIIQDQPPFRAGSCLSAALGLVLVMVSVLEHIRLAPPRCLTAAIGTSHGTR
jgi:hypothetical protein